VLTATLILLLCGTGVLMVVGYLNGNVMAGGGGPVDPVTARLRRFYVACLMLVVLGVAMMLVALTLPNDPALHMCALYTAVGYLAVGGGMAACHRSGYLRRGSAPTQ